MRIKIIQYIKLIAWHMRNAQNSFLWSLDDKPHGDFLEQGFVLLNSFWTRLPCSLLCQQRPVSPCPREGTQLLFAESMDEGYYCLISQEIKDEREWERETRGAYCGEQNKKKRRKLTKVLSKPKSIDRKSKKNCPSVDWGHTWQQLHVSSTEWWTD